MKHISVMKKYSGDCYILGSGASIGYFNKGFFDDKFTIGINRVAKYIKCNIVIAKEMPVRYGSEIMVLSKKQYGGYKHDDNTGGDYYFDHYSNKHDVIIFPKRDGWLVVSWSTMTSAMNMACYLGFKNIYLCGHDCGTINGYSNFDGYFKREPSATKRYESFLRIIEPQSIEVRDWLVKKYSVNICSLNPFVSLRLEGNKFE